MTRLIYRIGLAPLVAAALCAAPHPAIAAPVYTVLDLGTFGGPSSEAPPFGGGLDNAGQAAGQADKIGGGFAAFLTAPNSAITSSDNLGTLPGGTNSAGYGLNDNGEVVGFANTATSTSHAFVYDGVALHDLGTFNTANTASTSVAFGINDAGTVVGGADNANGSSNAFVHSGTTPLTSADNLGTFGGNQSTAQSINNSGQVTGEAQTAAGNFHAFLYNTATGTGKLATTANTDLGTLETGNAGESFGYGLNAAGTVVGTSDTSATDFEAFMDSGGVMTGLGTLTGDTDSQAFGINGLGDIVGESDSLNPAVGYLGARAFLDTGSGLEDLNTLLINAPTGYVLAQGLGINDQGQIVADGYTANGQVHDFLLTPQTAAVPEPGTLMPVVLGLSVLGLCVRRRRA